MELKIGDTVYIKENFWDKPHKDSPKYPKDMYYTHNKIGTITDANTHNDSFIYEVPAKDGIRWWYWEEALTPLVNEERLFELYVKGIITSDEYNTLSKVKEGE